MNEPISIITDEISQDLRECEAFLVEHELHAVELRCISDRRLPELDASDRERLAEWALRGDPVITAISPGLFKCKLSERQGIERDLKEVLPRALDLAHALGAENLIAFTFEAEGHTDFPAHALDALAAAARACAEAGIPLLLENEPGYLASTAARTVELIREVDHPNLCVNWDPTNGNEFATDRLAAAVEVIAPWLRNVHVKNGNLRPGELFAQCCRLRDGEIDWPAHLAQLMAIRYDGYFAIETHFLPSKAGSREILGELREMLAAIGYLRQQGAR